MKNAMTLTLLFLVATGCRSNWREEHQRQVEEQQRNTAKEDPVKRMLRARDSYGRAMIAYQNTPKSAPQQVWADRWSLCKARLKQWRNATTQVLNEDPNHGLASLYRGRLDRHDVQTGKPPVVDKALGQRVIADFERAFKAGHASTYDLMWCAEVRVITGDTDGARADYNRAIQMESAGKKPDRELIAKMKAAVEALDPPKPSVKPRKTEQAVDKAVRSMHRARDEMTRAIAAWRGNKTDSAWATVEAKRREWITRAQGVLDIDPTHAEASLCQARLTGPQTRAETAGFSHDLARRLAANFTRAFADGLGTAKDYMRRGLLRETLGDGKGATKDYAQALRIEETKAMPNQRLIKEIHTCIREVSK